jgi:hypothetical protein
LTDTRTSKTQYISVDWSDGIDYTAVSCYCTSCKTIFNIKYVQPGEDTAITPIYRKCPHCGAEFKKHIIYE